MLDWSGGRQLSELAFDRNCSLHIGMQVFEDYCCSGRVQVLKISFGMLATVTWRKGRPILRCVWSDKEFPPIPKFSI